MIKAKEIKKANRIIFDRDSLSYSKKRRIRFDKKNASQLIQRYEDVMDKKFQPVERFLDLGCGNGLISLNLALSGFISRPYGIDISLGMLKEYKNNAKKLGTDIFLILRAGVLI
jgi:tRNA/tmRNA/rRNA uracil-C5-methylase (TrmA/RlmC/RlmD family)